MRKRCIAWLVASLSRWQDRYTLLDTTTAQMRTFNTNAGAGAYDGFARVINRPISDTPLDFDPDDYPVY